MFLTHFWQSLSVGLAIFEYSRYSSYSRYYLVLDFPYKKFKISNSILLCQVSKFSFALSFTFLFCHRCLKGRCLPFAAVFSESLPNKGIFLLSSKHQFQHTLAFPRPVLHYTLLTDSPSSAPFYSETVEAKRISVQCQPHALLAPAPAFVKRKTKNINRLFFQIFPFPSIG